MTAKTFEPLLGVLGGNAQAAACRPDQFSQWLDRARPGDRIVYAEARWLPKEAVCPVLALVRASYDAGEVLFYQEKHASVDGRYRYFAVRRERRLQPAPAQRFVARDRVRGRVNGEPA